MFHDFTESFPACVDFDQKNLQRHVRESLGGLKTGTSNEGNGKAALQSNEVMKRLKLTNSYASKVMLAKREAIINGASEPSPTSSSADGGSCDKPGNGEGNTQPSSRRLAKGRTASQLSEDFKSSAAAWEEHLKRKNVQVELSNLKYDFKIGLISEEDIKRKAEELLKL